MLRFNEPWRRCLRTVSRLQDFAKALSDPGFRHGDEVVASVATSAGPWKGVSVALGMISLVFGLLWAGALYQQDPVALTHRASVLLREPRGGEFGTMGLSRDGSIMVYEGPDEDGGSQLWVRRWDELGASPLPGTVQGISPSISPDGREVVFMVAGAVPRRLMIAPLGAGFPGLSLMRRWVIRTGLRTASSITRTRRPAASVVCQPKEVQRR